MRIKLCGNNLIKLHNSIRHSVSLLREIEEVANVEGNKKSSRYATEARTGRKISGRIKVHGGRISNRRSLSIGLF